MSRPALTALPELAAALAAGTTTPSEVVDAVIAGCSGGARPEAWIHRVDDDALRARAHELEALGPDPASRPLYGIPFAVKDNLDAAGMPTSAGCPAFASTPQADATAVARLLDAGAILVGKTHMDQFATGLVGTRSPLGPCRNAIVPEYISGGSSSGSAVVVALGLVSFALGTDTAGSGRVPAAYQGLVGVKPTRGLVPLRGVVPACATLDCVSVFAASADAAGAVLSVLEGFDAADPFSRVPSAQALLCGPFRFGVPSGRGAPEADAEAVALFEESVRRLEAIGGTAVAFDEAPLRETASLLYEGPWLAERDAAVGDFLRAHPEEVDPTVASIIRGAEGLSARAAFEAEYALRALRRRADALFDENALDLVVVPTAVRAFRIDEVAADPVGTNAQLAATNNFMNLLDWCGCAVPAGVRESGVPFGVTLCAPAFHDRRLLDLARRLERGDAAIPPAAPHEVPVLVVGAHLRGMPLNHQLTDQRGRFLEAVRTSPHYRLHALDSTPPKPGLKRVDAGGVAIEAELWALPVEGFGHFTLGIPRPLAMGRVTLEDGREVPGFVCEPEGLGGEDVSHFGGWRAYMASRN